MLLLPDYAIDKMCIRDRLYPMGLYRRPFWGERPASVFYFRYGLSDSQADQRYDSKGGTARNLRLYTLESSRFQGEHHRIFSTALSMPYGGGLDFVQSQCHVFRFSSNPAVIQTKGSYSEL